MLAGFCCGKTEALCWTGTISTQPHLYPCQFQRPFRVLGMVRMTDLLLLGPIGRHGFSTGNPTFHLRCSRDISKRLWEVHSPPMTSSLLPGVTMQCAYGTARRANR